jgi:hypothetical protein
MALGKLWAGHVHGTNIGNLFVELEGEDTALQGKLRFNDNNSGVVVYNIKGGFDGARFEFSGQPDLQPEGPPLGTLKGKAQLNARGDLQGTWETSIGTGGTFYLFSHDRSPPQGKEGQGPDQLHTARYNFGAVGIALSDLIELADDLQRDLQKGRVVVTVLAGTEQSRFLEDFKKLKLTPERAEVIKIFAQEPDAGGVNRVVQVEFGPQFNQAMTQGPDEAWVRGKLEKLKQDVRRFERSYATTFKRFGLDINSILILSTLVYLTSLPNLRDRAVLMGGVLALIFASNWLHTRYLPFAAIYLREGPPTLFGRVTPSLVSWLIAATSGAAATLLAAHLQGWKGP